MLKIKKFYEIINILKFSNVKFNENLEKKIFNFLSQNYYKFFKF